MKRTLATMAAVAGLAIVAVPGASATKDDNSGKSAIAKECTQLKKADKAAFSATYGKHAMRTCKKGDGPAADEVGNREFKNAAQECRAERAEGPETFQETYGANKSKRNAFGKCVSGKVTADDEGGDDEGVEGSV